MFWVDGDIVGGLNCRFELDGKTFRDPSTVAKLMFKDWLKLEEIQASERTSMFETVLVWASGWEVNMYPVAEFAPELPRTRPQSQKTLV